MNKRGETGTEYPVIVVAEIVLAIFVGWLFINEAQDYASNEIHYKQEIAKEIGLAIDALSGMRGNAYVEFNDLYNYRININNNKVEISTKARDLTPGIYYFVTQKENDINPKNINLENPLYFAINKQGKNIYIDYDTFAINKFECDKEQNFRKITQPIILHSAAKKDSDEYKELEKISDGLKGSVNYIPSSQLQIDKFLLALNINNINLPSNHIKAYISHNSRNTKEALTVSCFIINEMMERVNVDSYVIIPIDTNRVEPNDPRYILKDQDFAIYLELGNIANQNYHKIPSDFSISIIKGIEEYNK